MRRCTVYAVVLTMDAQWSGVSVAMIGEFSWLPNSGFWLCRIADMKSTYHQHSGHRFHLKCVGLSQKTADRLAEYRCASCAEKTGDSSKGEYLSSIARPRPLQILPMLCLCLCMEDALCVASTTSSMIIPRFLSHLHAGNCWQRASRDPRRLMSDGVWGTSTN